MNKNFKKICLIIVLIIITLSMTSCSKAPINDGSGYSFNFYDSYSIEDKTYSLYALDEESMDLKEKYFTYYYKEYSKEDVSTWTINYIDTYSLLVNKEGLTEQELNEFNNVIQGILKVYESKLNLEFELYSYNTGIKKEYTINNFDLYESVLIIDMYIPFRLEVDRVVYFIYVPVKTFIGYKVNNQIDLEYDSNNIIPINYDDFIFNTNVHIK